MPVSMGFRFIRPKRSFLDLGRKVERELESRADQVAGEIRHDFEKTTESWDHAVEFVEHVTKDARGITISVSTDDEIYNYVNGGTKPHAIPKVAGGKRLRFQWDGPGSYQAKTRPGTIGSGPGGSSGPYVSFKSVWHPGTEPRNFDMAIYERWSSSGRFKAEMQDAVNSSILGW